MTSSTTNCADAHAPIPQFARTWLENWPDRISSLSFRQQGFCLDQRQSHALGRRNGIFTHCFEDVGDDCLITVVRALDDAIAGFHSGAFVRLGSRSAKDTPTAILTSCRAWCGREVIALVTGGSHRMSFDLRLCVRNGYRPWVFLREWRDFPWWAEFRCFLCERRLVGISQYHHRHALPAMVRSLPLDSLAQAVSPIARSLSEAFGDLDLVFDVFIAEPECRSATLIEINPWGPPTDACLFSWEHRDFDGSIRVRNVENPGYARVGECAGGG
jgi:hypothetical protein